MQKENKSSNTYSLKTLRVVTKKTQAPIIPIAQYNTDFYLNAVHSLELKYSNNILTLRQLIEKEERRRNEVIMFAIPIGERENAIRAIEKVLTELFIKE